MAWEDGRGGSAVELADAGRSAAARAASVGAAPSAPGLAGTTWSAPEASAPTCEPTASSERASSAPAWGATGWRDAEDSGDGRARPLTPAAQSAGPELLSPGRGVEDDSEGVEVRVVGQRSSGGASSVDSRKGKAAAAEGCGGAGECAPVNEDAVVFGARLGIGLGCASLFLLVGPPGDPVVPQAVWIMITVLIVSWFPSLDAGSTIEKAVQRVIGTIAGAVLGLGLGFASITMHGTPRSIFMFLCITVVGGLIAFSLIQWGHIFGRMPYAVLLCDMTFIISFMAFYASNDPLWANGLWRVANILIGCVLSVVVVLLVVPRSTSDVVYEGLRKETRLIGEAARCLLLAAALAKDMPGESGPVLPPLVDVLLGSKPDALHKAYSAALRGIPPIKAMLGVIKFDPIHHCFALLNKPHQQLSRRACSMALARLQRVLDSIILLDSLLRNEKLQFPSGDVEFFAELALSIDRVTLVLEPNTEPARTACEALLAALPKLEKMRQGAAYQSSVGSVEVSLPDKLASQMNGEDDLGEPDPLRSESARPPTVYEGQDFVTAPRRALSVDRKPVHVAGHVVSEVRFDWLTAAKIRGPPPAMPQGALASRLLFLSLLEYLLCRLIRFHSVTVENGLSATRVNPEQCKQSADRDRRQQVPTNGDA